MMAIITFTDGDFSRGELQVPDGVTREQVTNELGKTLGGDSCWVTFARIFDDGLMIDYPVDVVTTPDKIRSIHVWEARDDT